MPLAALCVLVERGVPFAGSPVYEARGQTDAIYAAVAAMRADGPILELPSINIDETESMLGQTRHWRPLTLGHTGYQPPLRALVNAILLDLPDPGAIDNVVAVTGVRWLLLAPRQRWPNPRALDGIRAIPGLVPLLQRDGWLVVYVFRRRAGPGWAAEAARIWPRGYSALGVPLEPLDAQRVTGELRALDDVRNLRAGRRARFAISVANTGDVAWPVVPGGGSGGVALELRWPDMPAAAAVVVPLHHDLRPGEQIRQPLSVQVPNESGKPTLEVRLVQVGGSPLERVPPLVLDGARETGAVPP